MLNFGEKPNILEISAASDEQDGDVVTRVKQPRVRSQLQRSSVMLKAGTFVQTDLSDLVELDYVPEQWEEDDNYSEQVQQFLKQLEDAEQLGQVKVKEQTMDKERKIEKEEQKSLELEEGPGICPILEGKG